MPLEPSDTPSLLRSCLEGSRVVAEYRRVSATLASRMSRLPMLTRIQQYVRLLRTAPVQAGGIILGAAVVMNLLCVLPKHITSPRALLQPEHLAGLGVRLCLLILAARLLGRVGDWKTITAESALVKWLQYADSRLHALSASVFRRRGGVPR